MPVETELRFQLTAAQARALAADSRLAAGLHRRPLTSIYFDTPEFALAQRRAGLRLRRVGRAWLQTLKCELPDAPEYQRGEWEWPVARAALDFTKLVETPLAGWFEKPRNRLALAPCFETRFARSAALIEFGPSSIEVAIDRGKLIAGDRAEPILEFEMELKAGPVEGLYEAAHAFNRDYALMPEPRSKAARGFALVTGNVAAPMKAGRLQIDPDATVEQAFVSVILHCIAHLQANAAGVRSAEDPEYVHQARVALRRLRSALVTFRRAVPRSASDSMSNEARALATAMGDARDLDVFEDETLKPLARAGHQPLLAATHEQLELLRRKAHRHAAEALSPPRYTAFVLDLHSWLERCGWRLDAKAAEVQRSNILRFAASTLDRRHRAVLSAGALPSSMAPAARHELRIAIKKLRYAAEFFSSLFPVKASAPYLDAMAQLQQALGTLNDIETGTQLAAGPFAGSLDPAGQALLAGWRLGLGSAVLHEADRGWSQFEAVDKFW
jgi:inorganic triphosphatase YgiF